MEVSKWAVFFLVVWALYTIRHAYAKLTQAYAEWKVAYAVVFCLGLLTRVVTRELFCQQIWRSQLWSNFCLAFCGFISLYLAFCTFISFHFGLLWLHFFSFWPFVPSTKCLVCVAKGSMAASFIPLKMWGSMAGAISCLRRAYAEVTQRLRGGSW